MSTRKTARFSDECAEQWGVESSRGTHLSLGPTDTSQFVPPRPPTPFRATTVVIQRHDPQRPVTTSVPVHGVQPNALQRSPSESVPLQSQPMFQVVTHGYPQSNLPRTSLPPPPSASPSVNRRSSPPMPVAPRTSGPPYVPSHEGGARNANTTSYTSPHRPPPTPRLPPGDLPPEEDLPVVETPPSPSSRPNKTLAKLRVDLRGDDLDGLSEKDAAKPATEPPRSLIRLRCRGFPWEVRVEAKSKPVSIGHVVRAIRDSLRARVTDEEYKKCTNESKPSDITRMHFLKEKWVLVGLEAPTEDEIWMFVVEQL